MAAVVDVLWWTGAGVGAWLCLLLVVILLPEDRQEVIRGGAGDLPICEHYHVHVTNIRVSVHPTVHVHHDRSAWASVDRDEPAALPAAPRALEPVRGMVVDGYLTGQPAERMQR